MKYPQTHEIARELTYRPIIPLAEAVAKRDRFSYERETIPWRVAAQAVAQACKFVPENQSHLIRRSLTEAKRKVQDAHNARPDQNRLDDVQTYLRLLHARNQPLVTQKILYDLHENIIDRLHRIPVAEKWPFTKKQFQLGPIAELTCLALLNRYAHPAIIALPALENHDQGSTPGFKNYDIAVGVSPLHAGSESESHLLQIKLGCTGWCGEDIPRGYDGRRTDAVLDAQHHSVALISGCCDLGIKPNLPLAEQTFELLKQEYSDQLTDDGIKKLDILTDSLHFSLGASYRLGRLAVSQQNQAV
jgi:cellobiose-specific phosphotransferase system component IIA